MFSFAELCEVYHVSRKTGYKWMGRFGEHPSPAHTRRLKM